MGKHVTVYLTHGYARRTLCGITRSYEENSETSRSVPCDCQTCTVAVDYLLEKGVINITKAKEIEILHLHQFQQVEMALEKIGFWRRLSRFEEVKLDFLRLFSGG